MNLVINHILSIYNEKYDSFFTLSPFEKERKENTKAD